MSEGEEVSADLLELTEQIGHAHDIEQPREGRIIHQGLKNSGFPMGNSTA